jgi:hypothetical protein
MSCRIKKLMSAFNINIKGEAISLLACTSLEGTRKLRIPDFKTVGT